MSSPAGWYPQVDGQQRFWDGRQWTEHFITRVASAPVYSAGALNAAKAAAQRATWVGLVIFVVGVIITWGTYSAANPGGGFVVAWGAIIFGGHRLARGLYYLGDPTRLLK